MSKLSDFYKKAAKDDAAAKKLFALRQEFSAGKIDKEKAITQVIALAKEQGTVLTRADFDVKFNKLEESELAAVAGGACAGNAGACGGDAALCSV
jgi:uncharacterized membrane-anchored protein